MKLANISMSANEIELVLGQSAQFRSIVANFLVMNASLVQTVEDQLTRLTNYVKTNFNYTSKIPAIKYVRQWAADNGYKPLQGLADAKAFVDALIPYQQA